MQSTLLVQRYGRDDFFSLSVKPQHARTLIAAIKVAVPNMAVNVLDRAIQAHGAAGFTPDVR